jgi:membrane fusion protein (multidrug efflux system)
VEAKGKFNRRWLVAAGVVILLLAVYFALKISRDTGQLKPGAEEGKLVAVEVVPVQYGSISRRVSFAAKIAPAAEMTIIPKVGGRVASVLAEMGDQVSAGQVLVQLEDTDYAIQAQQAEASLDLAVAGQKSAAQNLQRMEQLYQQGAVSRKDYDSAVTASEQADAQVKQASASLAYARYQAASTAITSPANGIIASRRVDIGEMVNAGSSIFTVVDIASVYAECSIPESEVGRLVVGQKVAVLSTAVSGQPFEGTLTNLAPAADAVTKAFAARFKIENPGRMLKPGMFAQVELAVEEHLQALLVPKGSVVEKVGQKFIFLAREGKAIETSVVTGIADGETVEVLEGLQAGDLVITTGQNALQDGIQIEIRQQ